MHLALFIYYFNFPCFQLISQPFLTECQFRESAFNITTKSVTVQRWMFPDYLTCSLKATCFLLPATLRLLILLVAGNEMFFFSPQMCQSASL